MGTDDQAYIKLQKHLDRQPMGFPATRSGVEISILKHIFTPLEAEIATCLHYRPEPLETIHRRAAHLGISADDLAGQLDQIRYKGGIEAKTIEGVRYYNNIPLVVGMFEMQLGRLTPEFLENFDRYTADIHFGIEFLSSKLPQMRTVPVEKSICSSHLVSTFDEVAAIVDQADAPFAAIECICRKKQAIQNNPCRVTNRKETCLTLGHVACLVLENDIGREISRRQALAIIEQNQKEGLVLQPANTEKVEFICSCCGCCCGLLRMHQVLPSPQDFWVSNFYAMVDTDICDGCGACTRRCQVAAVGLSPKTAVAVVDVSRCLGCGVCVTACRAQAITLAKKPVEIIPPQTREELYEMIMASKKGTMGKLKLTGKLFFDALRSGHTHLLKQFPVGDRSD